MGKWERKRKICRRSLTSFTDRSLSISKRITNVLKNVIHCSGELQMQMSHPGPGVGVRINLEKLA